MASTYSSLKIQLIGTGDQAGAWGVTTNNNFQYAVEEAIVGSADVTFASADVTLTLSNTNLSQTARNLRLNLTGTSGGARNLYVPAIEKFYIINNGLADAVTVKNATGTGVLVAAGKTTVVYNDGTNVVDAVNTLDSLTLNNPLAIASGGTGQTTKTNAFDALSPTTTKGDLIVNDGTDNVRFGVGTNGYFLTADSSTPTGLLWSPASPSGVTLSGNNPFTGANTFFNNTGQTFGTGTSTQDGLILAGRAGGSSSYRVTLQPDTLSASRTVTLPDGGANYSLGYLNIPAIADKTSSYQLTTADVGKVVGVGTGGSITIPDAIFAAGDAVLVFNNTSSNVTITCSITTAYIAGTDSSKASITLATRGIASILFISSTVCVVTGNVS